MKRIKNFKMFNEAFEVNPPKMPYMGTVYIQSMKDPDINKRDIEGKAITPKVPQFEILKTIKIILTDGNLSAQAAKIFPDTDLTKALKNPEMLGSEDIDKLNRIYNEIILNNYELRQKYNILEIAAPASNYNLSEIKDGKYRGSIKGYEVYMDGIDSGFKATTGYKNVAPIICMVVIKDGHATAYSKNGILFSDEDTQYQWANKYGFLQNDPLWLKYRDIK